MSTTKIFVKIFLYVGSNNPETFQFVCLMKNIPTVLSRISDYPLLIKKKKKGHLQIFVFKKKKNMASNARLKMAGARTQERGVYSANGHLYVYSPEQLSVLRVRT